MQLAGCGGATSWRIGCATDDESSQQKEETRFHDLSLKG
jgi:hypothetical protein